MCDRSAPDHGHSQPPRTHKARTRQHRPTRTLVCAACLDPEVTPKSSLPHHSARKSSHSSGANKLTLLSSCHFDCALLLRRHIGLWVLRAESCRDGCDGGGALNCCCLVVEAAQVRDDRSNPVGVCGVVDGHALDCIIDVRDVGLRSEIDGQVPI